MFRPWVISQTILSFTPVIHAHSLLSLYYIIFWGYHLISAAHISWSHLSNNSNISSLLAYCLAAVFLNIMLSASSSFMLLCCTHLPPHHHHPNFTDSQTSSASPFHLSRKCYQPLSLPVYGLHGSSLLGAAQGRHPLFTKISLAAKDFLTRHNYWISCWIKHFLDFIH